MEGIERPVQVKESGAYLAECKEMFYSEINIENNFFHSVGMEKDATCS